MEDLVVKIADYILKQPIRGNDFVDRLHYIVTVAILFLFAFAAGLQEYVGTPIDCWTPLDFPDGADSYHLHINSYCWTRELRYPKFQSESYLANKSHDIFAISQEKSLINVGTAFFRWVTVIFVIQACFFNIPNFFWQQMNTSSGADLEKIRELGQQAQTAEDKDKKRLKVDEVVAFFENWISDHRLYYLPLAGRYSAKILSILFCIEKRSGSFLSSLYLTMKVLNFINVVGNFFLLTTFLDINFWKYGLVVLNNVINYGEWHDPVNFPRLLMCDFVLESETADRASSAAPREFLIQCTMTINIILEKIFVLEWFWFTFLFFVTLFNLLSWVLRIKPPVSTVLFMKLYINKIEPGISQDTNSPTHAQINNQKKFIEDYLQSDGVFILRMLELNADKALVCDVVNHLWNSYSSRALQGNVENGRCNNESQTIPKHRDEVKETQTYELTDETQT